MAKAVSRTSLLIGNASSGVVCQIVVPWDCIITDVRVSIWSGLATANSVNGYYIRAGSQANPVNGDPNLIFNAALFMDASIRAFSSVADLNLPIPARTILYGWPDTEVLQSVVLTARLP